MRFELSDALIDRILFAMEDQKGAFVLDAESGTVVPLSEAEGVDPEAVYELPPWGPADGFRLMEGFAASLRGPLVRAELSAALDRGRGVFRAFKDVLSAHPEVERHWFSFKEKRMRQEVVAWYNALRESWGLERIGDEPEETEDLLFEDFRFRPALPEDADAAAELRRVSRPDGPEDVPLSFDGSVFRRAIVAENARGEIAAFAATAARGSAEQVADLVVGPEYRGLGVGEELLRLLVEASLAGGAVRLDIDLPTEAEAFSRVLYREGFEPYETRFKLDLRRLRSERA